MGRIKSLLTPVKVDEALKSHDCQHNGRHRINRGDHRLKVKNRRGWDHYCVNCAQAMVQRDIVELQALLGSLEFSDKICANSE